MKRLLVLVFAAVSLALALPASADDQINYVSQPDDVTVFLNGVAFVRDHLQVPAGSDLRVVLPSQIYQDTLIVREGDARVPVYSVSGASGQIILQVRSAGSDALRDLTLEYLTSGISWQPSYTMTFSPDNTETVGWDFFAQIQNDAFTLDGIDVTLAAGRVDVSQQLTDVSTITANQYMAGYDERDQSQASLGTGAVTIQYVYTLADVTSEPGETLYAQLLSTDEPARRLLLWNASADLQANVIYKVRNRSDIAFAEGTVRSYQNGMFVGGDFVEFTPVGSEGSVTVGNVQDLRVNKAESVTTQDISFSDADVLHEITLTLSNYSQTDLTLDVVDTYPAGATEFKFSMAAQQEAGNLLRWTVTVPKGETVTITYSYRSVY